MNKATRTLTLLLLALLSLSTHWADDEKASPPPAPPKANGELTDGEKLFQGGWRLGEYKNDAHLGTMRFDGRDFSADSVHGDYVGYVSIRSDTSPAQVDFTIEDCECKFKGNARDLERHNVNPLWRRRS